MFEDESLFDGSTIFEDESIFQFGYPYDFEEDFIIPSSPDDVGQTYVPLPETYIQPVYSTDTLPNVQANSNFNVDYSYGSVKTPSFTVLPTSPVNASTASINHISKVDEVKKPRKRKRYSNEEEVNDLPNPRDMLDVVKFEDPLSVLNSEDFDNYIVRLESVRLLNDSEKEIVKNVRRRIKNRESARKSRRNKRNKLDDLETKVDGLRKKNIDMKEEISKLKNENMQLKNEVNYLQRLVTSNPMFSNIYKQVQSTPAESREKLMSSAMATQSFFLMAILFSFGIMWNLNSAGNLGSMLNMNNAENPMFRELPKFNSYDGSLTELFENALNNLGEIDYMNCHGYSQEIEDIHPMEISCF
eukprot:TRINITY_DN11707_c0_g1_i1.p1 TRINITY_DN11707_c0_g1~~TRINITY_DN11707_c0_g1_i1.p1  ORF type:complete len:358 (-),score=91.25 TRINITY_DN11707_c0_g1_i1:65-1138(-)